MIELRIASVVNVFSAFDSQRLFAVLRSYGMLDKQEINKNDKILSETVLS